MIFTIENLNLQILIWNYLWFLVIKKKSYFNNYKVDCVMSLIAFHIKLIFLKEHFSVLTLFVVVYVTSHLKKNLYANFWNIVRRGNILKIEWIHFSRYKLTTLMQFQTQNWYKYYYPPRFFDYIFTKNGPKRLPFQVQLPNFWIIFWHM